MSTQPIPQSLALDPDESKDIEDLIAEIVPDPEMWKQTQNPNLGGKKPVDLFHTPQEHILRDLLRAAKHGYMS